MAQDSGRLHLPMLRVGQAQKEATHNKALTLPDMATQPSVVAIDRNVPPTSPAIGQCCSSDPHKSVSGRDRRVRWRGGPWQDGDSWRRVREWSWRWRVACSTPAIVPDTGFAESSR